MMGIFVILTLLGISTTGASHVPGLILNSCASTSNTNLLDSVDFTAETRIFVYLKRGDKDGKTVMEVKNGDKIFLRIVVDCGSVPQKVNMARKVGNDWVNLLKNKPITCEDRMLVVLNSFKYRKNLWVGDAAYKYDFELKGEGDMTVKGARTVEVMGAGVACVVYPLEIKSCQAALKWYKSVSDCTQGGGYFSCKFKPSCDGDKFKSIQLGQTQKYVWYTCSDADGILYRLKYIGLSIEDAKKKCSQ